MSKFDFLKFLEVNVSIWKVALVGLPIALAVYFLFNGKKTGKLGYLSPVLWVFLTVVVLFFWSNEGGNGQGGTVENGSTEETTSSEGSHDGTADEPTGEGEGNVASAEPPKPIALIIRYDEKTEKYTVTDTTNNVTSETEDIDKKLKSLQLSGYTFTQIDTYGLDRDQQNDLREKYKVETTN